MSLFDKFKLIAKAKSNDLLDRIVDMDSPSILRQYARDLETEKENLANEAAGAAGHVRTLTRERDSINSGIESKKAQGTKYKNGEQTDFAKNAMNLLASQIVADRQTLALKEQDLAAATTASGQLDLVAGKVKAKSEQINSRIRELESIDATAKSKAHAAQVINHTSAMLGNVSTSSIDNIEQKIRANNDVADVKLERSMSEFDAANPDTTDPTAVSSVINEF